MLKFKAQF